MHINSRHPDLIAQAADVLDWISAPPGRPLKLPDVDIAPDGGIANITELVAPLLIVAAAAVQYATLSSGNDEAVVIFDLRTIISDLLNA